MIGRSISRGALIGCSCKDKTLNGARPVWLGKARHPSVRYELYLCFVFCDRALLNVHASFHQKTNIVFKSAFSGVYSKASSIVPIE